MNEADFFYQCDSCKKKISATWDNFSPEEMECISTPKGKNTEITFQCKECFINSNKVNK